MQLRVSQRAKTQEHKMHKKIKRKRKNTRKETEMGKRREKKKRKSMCTNAQKPQMHTISKIQKKKCMCREKKISRYRNGIIKRIFSLSSLKITKNKNKQAKKA